MGRVGCKRVGFGLNPKPKPVWVSFPLAGGGSSSSCCCPRPLRLTRPPPPSRATARPPPRRRRRSGGAPAPLRPVNQRGRERDGGCGVSPLPTAGPAPAGLRRRRHPAAGAWPPVRPPGKREGDMERLKNHRLSKREKRRCSQPLERIRTRIKSRERVREFL